MCKTWKLIVVLAACQQPLGMAVAAGREAESMDTRLRRAEAYMAGSDRYLHQSKLRRGMSGYGLTVMAGTKIEKFDAAVVSVLRALSGAPRDVILCKLSGVAMQKSGVIEGMSGSPVFVTDPADGKDKMIGAVAYSWSWQKEALCGVQPIAQMLAIQGVPLPGAEKLARRRPAPAAGPPPDGLLRAVLSPVRSDFARLALPRRLRRGPVREGRPRLVPLATPVMLAGASRATLALAEQMLAGTGLVPVQAGSVGAVEAAAAKNARLTRGMAVSIPLVTGDADWAAVGTVTEVIGDYVLALGHSFYGEGEVEMPMGPAYVHTIVASRWSSFKLGSTLAVTGALRQDEYTAVGGRIGQKARMVPMSLTVKWPDGEQKFQYRLLRHRWLTAVLGSLMIAESVHVNREPPQEHTIDYVVEIEFERLGKYRSANRTSARYELVVRSDVTRPLAALMNTSLGKPDFPKSINVRVKVEPVQKTATILKLALDRNVYKPGRTVRGKITLLPFRAQRTTTDVSVKLPEDLPDGQYTLTVCNAMAAVEALKEEMPHRFTPRTVEQLFAAIQEVVRPRADRLYLRLPLPEGGVAVKKDELEHAPASLAQLLAQAAPIDTKAYRRSLVVEFPGEYVLSGTAQASFAVERRPRR